MTGAGHAPPRTLGALLQRAVREGPTRGVHAPAGQLAWPEFAATAERFAHGLIALGCAPGDPVALFLEPSVELAVAVFGVALAGGISVPIQARARDAQVAHVLRDSGARLAVTSADKLAFLRDGAATFAAVALIAVGESAVAGATPYARALTAQTVALPVVDPRAAATILYTSGSTGLPKGIVQDQFNLAHGAEIVSGYLGLRGDDRILGVLPLSFDYGLNQLLGAAFVGADYVALPYFALADLVAGIEREQATVLAAVPPLWAALGEGLRSGRVAPDRLRSLRLVTNSGGRLHERDLTTLRTSLPWVLVFPMYGLTEAFRSSYLPPAELDRRRGSMGKAIPGVELLVIDPDTGAECASGVVGELVHAGALVAKGYWQNEAATARVFRPHPLDPARGLAVYSGDLVRRDDDGFLYYVARRDAQLKVLGHRVSPDEVEMVVNRVPGVQLGVVVGVDDPMRADTKLVACVVADGTADQALGARVRAACQRDLPAYMVPAEVRVVPAIPLTGNGKPDRVALTASLR